MRLALIIPTRGRLTLDRALRSLEGQLATGDEVLVIGDTFSGALPDTEQLVKRYGYIYLPHDAGRHAWGHPQINFGMTQTDADYLMFMDDDDVVVKGAFEKVRAALRESPEPLPHHFVFTTPWGARMPPPGTSSERPALSPGLCGGTGFVVPNVPEKLGTWPDRYEGDFDFVFETVMRWNRRIVWRPEHIVMCAP